MSNTLPKLHYYLVSYTYKNDDVYTRYSGVGTFTLSQPYQNIDKSTIDFCQKYPYGELNRLKIPTEGTSIILNAFSYMGYMTENEYNNTNTEEDL